MLHLQEQIIVVKKVFLF